MESNQNILLTGGTGFIGKHLIPSLLNANFSVFCLTRKDFDKNIFEDIVKDKINNLHIIYGDLLDKKSIQNKFNNIEIVLHFAGTTKGLKNIDYYFGNYIATKNLITELKKISKPKLRFILCSSQSAAGPAKKFEERSETESPDPISIYGKSKLKAEKILLENSEHFNYTILRPVAVFGPGDKDFPSLYEIIKKGFKVKILGSERYFNLIYVKDLVNITLKIILNTETYNKIYFLNDGIIYSWDSFANEIAKIFHKNLRTIYIPEFLMKLFGIINDSIADLTEKPTISNSDKFREFHYPYWICSNKEILKLIDDYKFYNINTALKETLQFATLLPPEK